jgi:ABC-type bacteriocin/lantibiotic exporter with double-glycine peptidase domain
VPVGALLGTVCAMTSVLSYLERLDDLLQAPVEQVGGHRPPDRLRGAVELRSVSYTYSSLLPPALHDVSAVVQPGEHVALVGPSGSGKTTLALLVATLYAPTSGAVLLDGVDVREHDLDALRRRIGVVTQAVTLFAASVRDNIAFGRDDLTDEDVVAAARLAALHDDIAALPSGYDTVLGNGGTGLSGGQRQRLALARALAGRPGLLVLDEATSALDPSTERAVEDALAGLRCTRLVVTHRPSSLAAADRVLVLDGGRLVADGTFASLRRRRPDLRALLGAG